MGLLGVSAEAKQRNLIAACKPALYRMIAKAGFRISDRLYAEYMRRMSE
jgi:predicted nucleic acid-binding protein